MKKYLLSCLLGTLLFSFYGNAQDWKSDFDISYWGPAEGMGMAFFEILQGPDGMQWLAASNGLYHYDGLRIVGHKVHYNNSLNSESDFYWAVIRDADRGMWFGTYNDGLIYWDADSGEVEKFISGNGRFPSDNVMQVVLQDTGRVWAIYQESLGIARIAGVSRESTAFEDLWVDNARRPLSSWQIPLITSNEQAVCPVSKDGKGDTWIGVVGGVIRADANRELTYFPIERDAEEVAVIHVEPDRYREGHLLLILHYGKEGGVFRFDPETGALFPVLTTESPEMKIPPTGLCQPEGRNQSLFIAGDQLLEVDAGNGQIMNAYLPKDDTGQAADPPFEIFSDARGRLWCAPKGLNPSSRVRGGHGFKSEGGLWCLFPESKQLLPFHNIAKERGAQGWVFESLNIDQAGNIWLSGGPGFFRLSPIENKNYPHFTKIKLDKFEAPQGRKEIWDGIELNDSTVLLATFNGGFKVVNLNSGNVFSHLPQKDDPNSLRSARVFSLFADEKRKILWLGHEKGIDFLDLERLDSPEKLTFLRGSYDPVIQSTAVYDIAQGPDDKLWVGTYGKGLLLFDPETDSWEQPTFTADENCGFEAENINVIRQDSRGNIWVGPGMEGLCRISGDSGLYCADCFLDGLYVVDFEEMPDGNILAAAMNYGLVILDPETEEAELFSMDNYLLRSSVLGVETDSAGRVWLPSIGLTKFKPDPENHPGVFINYLEESGLTDLDPGRCFFQGASGRFYYTSNQNLYYFFPEEVRENPNAPTIVFTDFRLFNESLSHRNSSLLDRPINSTDRISLRHNQHSFSFHFVGIEWRDPQAIRYAYRLSGAEERWNLVGESREARYTQLSPGQYIFEVKAANGDGLWGSVRQIRLEVRKPWWFSGLAIVSYVLLLAGIVFTVFTIYKRRWRLKAELESEHKELIRIQEVDELKTRLYTNITHEFRTPLTVIMGMADTLYENYENSLKKGLSMIRRNSRQLLRLVNQMMDLRKIEAGVMKVNQQPLEVIGFTRYIVESLHSLAESRQVAIHFRPALPFCNIYMDPDKWQNIVSNLLSNAIKFTGPGGSVYLEIEKTSYPEGSKQPGIRLIVRDTGVGIPGDKLDKVFDRFYQVDNSTTREVEGTGVGLALTKEFVHLFEGEITVESKEGIGTTFRVQLPVKEVEEGEVAEAKGLPEYMLEEKALSGKPHPDQEAPIPSRASSEDKPLILLVEDNKDVIEFIRHFLIGQFSVLEAFDGQQGIEMALEHIPDLIVSDIMMPRKDGLELCRTLKLDPKTSHIPIILLTAKAGIEDRIKGLERGAEAYLAKPFHKKELLVRIQQLILQRKKLQERYSSLIPAEPPENKWVAREDEFVRQVVQLVEENLDDPDFGVKQICASIFLSRSQVHRKLKALTNKSTSEIIRTIRLRKAFELLQKTSRTITEIAYDTGFNDSAYFSRAFSREFGVPPSAVRG